MTIIRLTGRRARALFNLHRRMLAAKALLQAIQNPSQHLLPIGAVNELGVQRNDWTLPGERPRMDVVDARNSGNSYQLRFDLPDIDGRRRSFEQHVRCIASELPARTEDQG
jgi:hypothetical protein